MGKVLFISGIDTDVGKTYATGQLAKSLLNQGKSVITQKLIQTGCSGPVAEDIYKHREIMGVELFPEDLNGLTSPYIMSYPCSPHLAAKIDQVEIDPEHMTRATTELAKNYDWVLVEGAGGLLVPLSPSLTIFDYVKEQGYPVAIVTSGKLGSINHTLLSLEHCKHHSVPVEMLIYNRYPQGDALIAPETEQYLQTYLEVNFPEAEFLVVADLSA